MSKCEGVKCSKDKICNPETGKCVKKDGRKGKKLIPRANSPRADSPRADSPRETSPRACMANDLGRFCDLPLTVRGSPFCQYHLDNINDVDIHGNTLLQIVFENYVQDTNEDTLQLIGFLIRNGARLDIQNRLHRTTFDYMLSISYKNFFQKI